MSSADSVTLRNASADDRLNNDVLAVCSDAICEAARIIGADPPLGKKPIVVQQSTDGYPRACLDGLPNEYWVNVTCLHSRSYARLAFQLGHELGHFYIDPRYRNWFIESVCTALAYSCLTALAEKWLSNPPYPGRSNYAPAFTDYRNGHVRWGLDELKLGGTDDISTWIRDSLPAVVHEEQFSRQHEALCAEAIAGAMSSHMEACSALTRLGEASHAGRSDFALWRAGVSPYETDLIDTLGELFSRK